MSTESRLPSGWSGIRIPVGERYFTIFQIAQNLSGTPPSLLFNGCMGFFPGRYSSRSLITTQRHPVLRVRMSRVIFLLSLYAVTTWTGTACRYTNSIQCGFVQPGQKKSKAANNIVMNLMGSIQAGMSWLSKALLASQEGWGMELVNS